MIISQIVDTEAIYRVAVQQLARETPLATRLIRGWSHEMSASSLVWPEKPEPFMVTSGQEGAMSIVLGEGLTMTNDGPIVVLSATQPGPAAR